MPVPDFRFYLFCFNPLYLLTNPTDTACLSPPGIPNVSPPAPSLSISFSHYRARYLSVKVFSSPPLRHPNPGIALSFRARTSFSMTRSRLVLSLFPHWTCTPPEYCLRVFFAKQLFATLDARSYSLSTAPVRSPL